MTSGNVSVHMESGNEEWAQPFFCVNFTVASSVALHTCQSAQGKLCVSSRSDQKSSLALLLVNNP